MKKYFVKAKKWDEDKKKVIEYIAGEFDDWVNASIFRNAYNEYYKAEATVVEFKF